MVKAKKQREVKNVQKKKKVKPSIWIRQRVPWRPSQRSEESSQEKKGFSLNKSKVYISLFLFILVVIISIGLASAAVPMINVADRVWNGSQNANNLSLGALTGSGDVAIVTISAKDAVDVNINSVSPSFSRAASAGGTRRSEIWAYQSIGSETIMPIITDNEINDVLIANGFTISGTNEDWLVQAIDDGQTNEANKTITVTTQRNNSLLLALVSRAINTNINVTDGFLINYSATGPSWTSTIIAKNTTTAGEYTIGALFESGALSSITVIEIASEGNGTANPSSNFNATNITGNKLAEFSDALYNSDLPNILWMGDSVAIPFGQLRQRWPSSFIRNFNHSNGWYSITTGAGTSNAGAFIRRTILTGFTGNSTLSDFGVTNDYWNDGTFYGSLWHGEDTVLFLDNDFTGQAGTSGIISWHANSSYFQLGRSTDWITGSRLTVQFGYMFDNNLTTYANNFTLRNGTNVYTYNITDGSNVINGLQNRRMGLLSQKIGLGVNRDALILSNVTINGGGNKIFDASIIKVNNEDNPTGISFATLGQSSTSYASYSRNQSPISSNKQFLLDDLRNYVDSVYNERESGDNFIFITMGAESNDLQTQISDVSSMVGNLTIVYANAGLNQPKIMLISTYRTFNQNESITQSEVFYNVSNKYSNVYFFSMYAATKGILLNNTPNSGQIAWAESNNYSKININNGSTLNFSNSNLIDSSTGVHQNGEEAAFFFAYLLNEALEENGMVDAGQQNDTVTGEENFCNTILTNSPSSFFGSIETIFILLGVAILIIVLLALVAVVMGTDTGLNIDFSEVEPKLVFTGILLVAMIAYITIVIFGLLCA